MLIVNHDQLHPAGIASLEQQCVYCSKALAAHPLILRDDADQTVYHVTCALELATDLLVDLATFFNPPAPIPPCMFSQPPALLPSRYRAASGGQRKESPMQSTNINQIKKALWDQAFTGKAQVWCPTGGVVAIRRRKGQLLALIRGWGRWYPVESVRIEHAGRQFLSTAADQAAIRKLLKKTFKVVGPPPEQPKNALGTPDSETEALALVSGPPARHL